MEKRDTPAAYNSPMPVSGFPRTIDDEELAFLQRLHPGVSKQDLREMLLSWYIATMALATHKYCCIRQLFFLNTTIDKHPKYKEALSRKAEGRWWVDVGSAFGQDVRLPVLDGWPARRMLATDIVPELWKASLGLYPNPSNIQFVTANVLDQDARAERLESYHGSVEVISSNLVLHTLGKEQVDGMLHAFACLLAPGGMVLGMCVGSPQPRPWTEYSSERWLHSPASLKEALTSAGLQQVVTNPVSLPGQALNDEAGLDQKIGISFSGIQAATKKTGSK